MEGGRRSTRGGGGYLCSVSESLEEEKDVWGRNKCGIFSNLTLFFMSYRFLISLFLDISI